MTSPLLWPRPGASVTALMQALNLAHDTAGNVVGPLLDPVQSYLRWASDHVDRLRWHMEMSDVDRLIRTPFFWAANGMDGTDPLASKLVSGEVDARRGDLPQAIQSIELFRRHWASDEPTSFVLPDTNVVLEHPHELEQVDWHLLARPHVLQLDQVDILVPLIVVDELDNAKRVNRTKSRARTALKTIYRIASQQNTLRSRLSELPSRGAAWLNVITERPGHQRLDRPDDELVRIDTERRVACVKGESENDLTGRQLQHFLARLEIGRIECHRPGHAVVLHIRTHAYHCSHPSDRVAVRLLVRSNLPWSTHPLMAFPIRDQTRPFRLMRLARSCIIADEVSVRSSSPKMVEARQRSERTIYMQVLITVKASPQPSASYGDTVCVAGIEIKDGKPVRWVRLYPVPFRYLDGEQQFKKYQIIDVAVTRNQKDSRPESYKIDAASLKIKELIEGWPARVPLVQSMVTGSMCGVIEAVRQNANGPSLALIEPREVLGLRIEPHPGWSPKQAAVLDRWVAQPELFGGGAPKRAIKAPRFTAKYRYYCAEPSCKSHEQGVLDWELTALQLKLAHKLDEQLQAAIKEKFYGQMCASGRATAFYVGNQAEPTRRRTFSVLGVYYPKAADAAVMQLF